MKRLYASMVLCALVFFSGCAPKVTTNQMHQAMQCGNFTILVQQLEADENSKNEFWYWLNLGRLYQHQGAFAQSIDAFNHAEGILTEYEDRAKVNLRGVASGLGSTLFSAGAERYYGKGYERTLMHTINSFNYAMNNDFMSACVELKKMEQRQEFWLQESEAVLSGAAEDAKKKNTDTSKIPTEYSMTAMLAIPEVNALANNYQDSFSYAVSAAFHNIIKDTGYAETSLKRAMLLNSSKVDLAMNKMPRMGGTMKLAQAETPAASRKAKKSPAQAKREAEALAAAQKAEAEMMDVTLILMTGLAPSLKIEKLRFPIGELNYTSLDMPALDKPKFDTTSPALNVSDQNVELPKLLQVDNMAYRTLKDELPVHFVKGLTRALAKGAVSYAASSGGGNDDLTKQLVGLFASITMDIASSEMDKSMRNWEMLPNSAYLMRFRAKRGSTGQLNLNSNQLPLEFKSDAPNGEVILISYMNPESMRISYATY